MSRARRLSKSKKKMDEEGKRDGRERWGDKEGKKERESGG